MVYGKLSKRSSLPETLLFINAKLPKVFRRHYMLQVTTPDRTLKQLQFSIPGKLDQVPVHHGDMVSILYTMRGYIMHKLVAVTNHTTGKRFLFPHPISSATHLSGVVGGMVLGLLLGAYLLGLNLLLASVVNAIGVLVFLKVTSIAQLTTPSLETREGKRLLADQQLLVQKRKIEQRVEELNHDSKANQVLIQQLDDLKRKMTHLDQRLYSSRIVRTNSAITILKQQIGNNYRLVREYGRAVKMIDIEVETSWIADQLPDSEDFTRKILRRLEELKTIEDQNQSLKFQLAAYEDIGRL
ncbi:hypothetical protein H6F43_12875 [Leptolyngbya sp. FACHB-36]|uniref:hypothetical protein n=1 Tax=Leptolyngbya sp. FACHB-36 TaxID=2692808 RepID=UPI0016805A56|nr:hypothetical protein [Leptolyngbya sp. FACHB-36]MBD2021073.1 hypothetical protein [Leptolyngbya sp. FACHB-36]